MNERQHPPDRLTGLIAEWVPERCQDCPVIGRLALMYAMLETHEALKPADARRITRAIGGRMGNQCMKGVSVDQSCGSNIPSPLK